MTVANKLIFGLMAIMKLTRRTVVLVVVNPVQKVYQNACPVQKVYRMMKPPGQKVYQ